MTSMTLSATTTSSGAPAQLPVASLAAEQVLLKEVSYLPSERKHLAKTLPWSLEEQLVDDVEDLHIAVAILGDDRALAAIVRKDVMQQKLQLLQEQNSQAAALVPEQLLLPWQAGQWVAHSQQQGKRWLLRTAAGSGFAASSDDLSLLLKLTAAEQGLPEKFLIYSDDCERDKAQLNNSELIDVSEWHSHNELHTSSEVVINLLQGEFAPRIAWEKIWPQWQKVAYFAIAVVVLQLVFSVVDYQLAKNRDLSLRQQIEQAYRQAIPSGNMIEPVRQLKRKLASYSTANSSEFMTLLNTVGAELEKNAALELQGLNYNEQKNALQLTLLADNFNSVETLRNNLESKGLDAKLSSSNAEGTKVRARLQITGN